METEEIPENSMSDCLEEAEDQFQVNGENAKSENEQTASGMRTLECGEVDEDDEEDDVGGNLKFPGGGQKFCERWLDHKEFKIWLAPVIGEPFKAWCKVCRRCLAAGKSELLKHCQTRKHKVKQVVFDLTPTRAVRVIDDADECPAGNYTMKPYQDDTVASAEIKLAAFAAEHNLMGKTVDHLCELVKELCQNSKLSKGLELSRFKCGTIIRNVLAKGVQQDLDEELAHKCFSLLIDESMDTPAKKVFCLAVRYFSEARNKIKTEILAELTVNAMEPSAGMMSAAFKDLLDRRGIPFENMIGMAADGASVMIGAPDSLQALLMNQNSCAVILPCISRSVMISLMQAVKVLPRNLEDLLRNMVNYRTQNLESHSVLKELQQNLVSELDKLPDPNCGSWILIRPCVSCVLEKMSALEQFFTQEPAEDRSSTTELIQDDLKNPYTKAFFLFLNYVLNIFANMTALYQSSNVLLPTLIKECHDNFRTLCQHFLNPIAFVGLDVSDVLPYEESNFLPLENIFVGTECQDFLNQLDPAENVVFLLKCREFFQSATSELKTRLLLPFDNVDVLNFLDPSVALTVEGHSKVPSLGYLGIRYTKFVDVSKLDDEWVNLPHYFSNADVEELQKLPLDSLWGIISDMRNEEDSPAFAELGKLAKISLSLPVPNLEAEQAFFLMKETKIKPRKLASSKTLHSLLMVKQAMIQDGTDCRQFTVTSRHLKLFRSDANDTEEVDEEECVALAEEG